MYLRCFDIMAMLVRMLVVLTQCEVLFVGFGASAARRFNKKKKTIYLCRSPMMKMIAPKSLALQKEGVQRKGEVEAGYQRRRGQTETPTSGAGASTGLSQSGVLDTSNRKNMDGIMEIQSTGRAEGARD